MKTFKIRCSDLAKLTGHNTFQLEEDTIEMLNQYNGFCETNYSKNEVKKILNIMSDSELRQVTKNIDAEKAIVERDISKELIINHIKSMDDSKIDKISKEINIEQHVDKEVIVPSKVDKISKDINVEQPVVDNKELLVNHVESMDHSEIKEIAEKLNIEPTIVDKEVLTNHIETMEPSILKETNRELYFARKSEQNKQRGIDNESSCVPLIENDLGVKIYNSNDKVYIKELFCTDKYRVILLGAVDGITDDGRVVEIKTRMRRLFNKLREYEQVQLEGYLYLTGYEDIILYENYRKKGNYIHYKHNNEFWDECIRLTKEFIDQHF